MYEGNITELQMVKIVSVEGILDETVHRCKVFQYDLEDDYIYLQLPNEELTAISLDAKYQCTIYTKKEALGCTGVVKERFQSENGNMVVFRIENGFYIMPERKRKSQA